jgi:hypothetical protein
MADVNSKAGTDATAAIAIQARPPIFHWHVLMHKASLDGGVKVNPTPAVCNPKKRTNYASEAIYHLKMMWGYGVIPRTGVNGQCSSDKVFSTI